MPCFCAFGILSARTPVAAIDTASAAALNYVSRVLVSVMEVGIVRVLMDEKGVAMPMTVRLA